MGAWSGLTKKEFQLGFPVFLIAVITFSAFFIGGYFTGDYIGFPDEILIATSAMVLTGHVFFLAIYMLHSLNYERKRMHLWLHNPMSIAGLLSSKLVTGFVYFTITFVLSLMLTIHFLGNAPDLVQHLSMGTLIGVMVTIVVSASAYLAAVVLFFWSIFQILSQRMNDFVSFIITFTLFLLIGTLFNQITSLPFIETLFSWGAIESGDILVGFDLQIHLDHAELQGQPVEETSILYIGHIVKDMIVAVILFIAACWLIDRKVEV